MRKLTICGCDIAEYTIVLNPIPEPADVTAAEFLVRVIETACGVTLPIADRAERGIYIGTREACDEVKLDGFRITTDDKNVYLDGNMARGTLYAAFDFAEKYIGYRHFAIDCEVIPTDGEGEVPVGLNIIDNPGMEVRRTTCHTHMRSPEFSVHCRLNDCCGASEALGGCTNYGACHSMGDYLKGSEYFAEHPEYFCLSGGKRIPCEGGSGPGNPCLTNPDVLRIITDKILAELREHPERTIVELSQTDGGIWCECDACRAVDEEEGSHAGTIIRFVNAVAEAVEKEFPNVRIQTFAYDYSRFPVKKTKARENVIIRYCTMSACFRHAIDDPNCPTNAATLAEMEGWRKMSCHMSVWDYITDWNCYIAPFPNLVSLWQNMRYFADCNVGFILEECNSDNAAGGAYPDLKAYVVGKLLWNPHMTEEEYRGHIAEFLRGFYGKGWHHIADYIKMEYEATKDRCVLCMDDIDICFLHYTSHPEVKMLKRYLRGNFEPAAFIPMVPNHPLVGIVDRMDEAKGYFDRAIAKAETDTERVHIERSRMAITYLDLFCSDNDEFKMTEAEKKEYKARIEKFYEDKKKYGFYYNLHTGNARKR
ncbi:MAG: DUF4838 domain-containing protein [Ruminococcaceae bacterium]|nr:DUF4838 domain-containing protein [Oscillospiraceae bacterium]